MASRAAIYGHIAMSRVRSSTQYRASFALQVVGAFGISFLDFIAILVMFEHVPHLAEWSLPEVAFLYGTSYLSFRVADAAMTNLDRLPNFIRMGSFDQVLTRPLGTLGQVLTGDLDVRHVGGMAQASIVLMYAAGRVQIEWTPVRVLVLIGMLVSGFTIFSAIWIATNAVTFWIIDSRELANAFTYGGNFFSQYPLTVFSRWLRRVLGYAFGLAFVNYFPALYILDKPNETGAPSFLRFLSPLVAVAAAIVAGVVWRVAVRHYRSTGS